MKVLALQVLTTRIEDQILPGSPDRTRIELRVPSGDYGDGNQPIVAEIAFESAAVIEPARHPEPQSRRSRTDFCRGALRGVDRQAPGHVYRPPGGRRGHLQRTVSR